ncbi:MAG: hypothetical protein ACOZFS_12995 [Thermodesulfobacteriota bacterium]
MAKNRYGWQKRAKELARKQKSDDKMKRRQTKAAAVEGEEMPEMAEEVMGDTVETGLQPNPIPHD